MTRKLGTKGMKYYKRNWLESRGDQYDSWGASIWYFEVGEDDYPTRQIEVYKNGRVLQYDDLNKSDKYGQLSVEMIDSTDFDSYRISKYEFDSQWDQEQQTTKWNRIGWVKSIIIFIGTIPYIFNSTDDSPLQIDLLYCLRTYLFFGIITFLGFFVLNKVKKELVRRPSWNENPLKASGLSSFIQFVSILLLGFGISMNIGSLIATQSLSFFGLFILFWGLGFATGLFLSLKFFTPNED